MMIAQTLKSAITFFRKEGLRTTIKRIIFVVWYNRIHTAEYIYRLSRKDFVPIDVEYDPNTTILRFNHSNPMPKDLFEQFQYKFGQYRGSDAVIKKVKSRLAKGADLWVLCIDGEIANTQWAFRGGFIEPFFFPICEDEVVFFDTFTFENFRGRALNKKLLIKMQQTYIDEDVIAFYLTIKSWNVISVKATTKARFEKIGKASKLVFFGKPLIFWHDT